MLAFPSAIKIYAAVQPVDMRKQFNGLWTAAQEQLREEREETTSRALADDLWILLPELPFESLRERARFLHNAAVFYGSCGPAADLGRARELFRKTLEHFAAHEEDGWRARALHNLATAIGNLQKVDATKQRGFARAGGANETGHLAWWDMKRDFMQRPEGAETFGNLQKVSRRHGHNGSHLIR